MKILFLMVLLSVIATFGHGRRRADGDMADRDF